MIEIQKQATSDDGSRESPSRETTTEQQAIVSELSLEGQLKLEVIQSLLEINIGFDAPSSQVVALALRHAILPKVYGAEYGLHTEWITYGKPEYLFTDGGKDFRSNHITEIGTQLGFVHKLRDRPSEGGIVERFFRTLNESVLRALPGYTGSNVQQRPKDAEQDARLTLRDLERVIVGFIVDRHNQELDARMGDQTRNQLLSISNIER